MAKSLAREIWIVGAKRTAFGTFGGALKDLTATDLAVDAAKAALAQADADPATVEHVVFGNVQQTSADAIYLRAPRRAARRACRSRSPALTRQPAVRLGLPGDHQRRGADPARRRREVVLVGGTESMTQAPHVVRGARWGLPFGKEQKLERHAVGRAHRQLHRHADGDHRREPGREVQDLAPGVRRVRAALAEALGRGQRGGPLQGRDRARRDQDARRAHGAVRRRRAPAPADDDGERSPSSPRSSRRTAWSPPATRRASATAPARWCWQRSEVAARSTA